MTNQNIILSITSFINIIILMIVYFGKERINNLETKRYSLIIITTLLIPIIEIVSFFVVRNGVDSSSFLYIILNKIILIVYVTWTLLFLQYMVITILDISEDKIKNTKLDQSFFIINIILAILILITKLKFQTIDGLIIPTGLATSIAYITAGLADLIMIVLILMNIKKAKSKKFVPLYTVIAFAIIALIIQNQNPEYFLMTSVLVYTTFVMYFTIENPDIKMIEALEAAREQADKANAAKTDFLSSMSHEIRTPLNAINGFSNLIKDAKTLEEAKVNARDIVNASDTLLEIVNGILDISKIEAGKLEIKESPYDAKETFESLAKLITPRMDEKGLDFTYSIAPDLPKTLYGDHANLKKVVTNFLSNAVKYTDKGFVRFEVNCINQNDVCRLIISVEDSGRGIKKENIDKLFTKFDRLEADRNSTIEGTGLGLAITKQLVELMGGKIIVHTVYREGSKFTVTLDQKISHSEIAKEETQPVAIDLKSVRILIVDDNELNLKVATKMLEKNGATSITQAHSGFECLDLTEKNKYDIILLDDMMPKMSGTETLVKLKQRTDFNTPVVALTANAISGMREKYLESGFDEYLAKPIDKEEFMKILNKILSFGKKAKPVEEQPTENNVTEEKSTEMTPVEETNVVEDKPVESSAEENTSTEEKPVEEAPKEELVEDSTPVEEKPADNTVIIEEDPVEEKRNYDSDEMETIVINDTAPVEEPKPEVEEAPKEELVEEPAPAEETPVEEAAPTTDSEVKEPPAEDGETFLRNHGVDMDKALELLGDMEMYNMTFTDFEKELENKWSKLEQEKLANDMENYAIDVHSLKSDCKYLGFYDLADVAYEHELKSKENDSEFVNSNFDRLAAEYEKVLKITKEYKEKLQ